MGSISRVLPVPSAPPFDDVQSAPQSPQSPPPPETNAEPRDNEKHLKTLRTVLLLCIFCCVIEADSALTTVYFDAEVLKKVDCNFGLSGIFADSIVIVICLYSITVACVGFRAAYTNNMKKLESYNKMISKKFNIQIIGIVIAIHRYCLPNKTKNCLYESFGSDLRQEFHNKTRYLILATFTRSGFLGPIDYLTMQQPISPSCCPRGDNATECFKSESYYVFECEEITNLMQFAYGGLLILSASVIVGLEAYCKHLSTRIINDFKMEAAKLNFV